MIKEFHPDGLPNIARESALCALNTLTLERNSVLVARVSKDAGYDLTELQGLKNYLTDVFPNHRILVWWDDIEFTSIEDKSYQPERMSLVNETASNYY